MSSREDILSAVRRNQSGEVEIPPGVEAIRYDDPRATFVEMLTAVGGTAVVVADRDELNRRLAGQPEYAAAARVCSLVPGVGRSDVDLAGVDDPHELADVDYAVLRARFGVAENGAIWLTDGGVRHRVVYFIAQHLGIVLPAGEIVHEMHEAYARLGTAAREAGHEHPFPAPGFGLFLSGPSKTADIEQSLVIGAHGARSLTVYLVEQWDE